MGFLRKTIILGTGGLAPIRSQSYAERTAKAMEKTARLQQQQMRAAATPPPQVAVPPSVAPGPRDPWLTEVAVALAEYDFTEFARNAEPTLCGVPLEGQIAFIGPRKSKLFVHLFTSDEIARQAEIGLFARPKIRNAIQGRYTQIKTAGRILYLANGQGRHLDPSYLDDVLAAVSRVNVPPPLPAPREDTPRNGDAADDASALGRELERLARLHNDGALTDEEFVAAKRKLLSD